MPPETIFSLARRGGKNRCGDQKERWEENGDEAFGASLKISTGSAVSALSLEDASMIKIYQQRRDLSIGTVSTKPAPENPGFRISLPSREKSRLPAAFLCSAATMTDAVSCGTEGTPCPTKTSASGEVSHKKTHDTRQTTHTLFTTHKEPRTTNHRPFKNPGASTAAPLFAAPPLPARRLSGAYRRPAPGPRRSSG